MNTKAFDFSNQVVLWQVKHGRNHLPWQNTGDPYKVWLSEIMLQQTQVVTVLDYFTRFLDRFPDIQALSQAHLDDVLAIWSGLGYYSRARNLHACAIAVVQKHGGSFPGTAEALQTLPGIGPSTAGAIASLCFGQRVAILDGNVKRVLTRFIGFDRDLSVAANERQLWQKAGDLLPLDNLASDMPRYTQGMMDLGATVCLPKTPRCPVCPLSGNCEARRTGDVERFPVKSRKIKRSAQSLWLLCVESADGSVWLSQRPSPGVWAGLYCFDLFEDRDALLAALPKRYLGLVKDESPVTHVLTHKDLYLHPVRVRLPSRSMRGSGQWFSKEQALAMGLPAPVRKMLNQAPIHDAAIAYSTAL